MVSFKNRKLIAFSNIVILLFSVSGLLAIALTTPDLYIRITEVDWPPTLDSQGETFQEEIYVLYHMYMKCELWNHHKYNLSIGTPNTNLLGPKMDIKLEEDYKTITGYVAFPIVTSHNISSGYSHQMLLINIYIEGYNLSYPPDGIYTLWAEIDGVIVPFEVKSFKTKIHVKNNQTTIRNEQTPFNWGSVTWFPFNYLSVFLLLTLSTELIVFVVIVYTKLIKSKNI